MLAKRYLYTDRDGTGRQDPAIRAYGSVYVGRECEQAGPWWRGKAIMRFDNGDTAVCRARLVRRIKDEL